MRKLNSDKVNFSGKVNAQKQKGEAVNAVSTQKAIENLKVPLNLFSFLIPLLDFYKCYDLSSSKNFVGSIGGQPFQIDVFLNNDK